MGFTCIPYNSNVNMKSMNMMKFYKNNFTFRANRSVVMIRVDIAHWLFVSVKNVYPSLILHIHVLSDFVVPFVDVI